MRGRSSEYAIVDDPQRAPFQATSHKIAQMHTTVINSTWTDRFSYVVDRQSKLKARKQSELTISHIITIIALGHMRKETMWISTAFETRFLNSN